MTFDIATRVAQLITFFRTKILGFTQQEIHNVLRAKASPKLPCIKTKQVKDVQLTGDQRCLHTNQGNTTQILYFLYFFFHAWGSVSNWKW